MLCYEACVTYATQFVECAAAVSESRNILIILGNPLLAHYCSLITFDISCPQQGHHFALLKEYCHCEQPRLVRSFETTIALHRMLRTKMKQKKIHRRCNALDY